MAVHNFYTLSDKAEASIFQLARVNRHLRDTVLSILFPPEHRIRLCLAEEPRGGLPIDLIRYRFALVNIMTRAEYVSEEKEYAVVNAEKANQAELCMALKNKEGNALWTIMFCGVSIESAAMGAKERKRRERRDARPTC